jgi:hypothetical protein
MGAGNYADAPGQAWLLGKPWLPHLWGPMAGAALFRGRVIPRFGRTL